MKKIVTIDGPAGSGKSTIAKLLANRIGFSYLDTGALYRCVTLHMINKDLKSKDEKEIIKELDNIDIRIEGDVFKLNGVDVTEKIRTDEVTVESPLYAKISEVRNFVKKIQKKIANREGFVIDGRDIGSVVFKDAFCKFYLDASSSVRAKRRLEDEKQKGQKKTLKEIEEDVVRRDTIDRTRKDSPLVIPMDALLIDTSAMSVDEVLAKMIAEYNTKVTLLEAETSKSSGDTSKLFLDALENISKKSIDKGTIVRAKIINIGEDRISLDLGDKKDAFIQAEEVPKVKEKYKVGDDIIVFVIGVVNNRSEVLVSYKEAVKREALVKFTKYVEDKKLVEGTISRRVAEGFLIDVEGVQCYCAFSDYDEKFSFFPGDEIGQVRTFSIKSIGSGQIVLSRIELVSKERREAEDAFYSQHKEGDVVSVTVKRFLKYGVYVTYNDFVGFVIKNKDVSWQRFDDVSKVLKVDEKINVKIVQLDATKRKVFVSKKDVDTNPMEAFITVHDEGEVLKGKVRSFLEFGAFVELEPGVDGLLHVSEMSWTKKVNKPEEMLKLGDEIEVMILRLDKNYGKISLGYKQTQGNPWAWMEENEPMGDVVSLEVSEVDKGRVVFKGKSEFEYVLFKRNFRWNDSTKEKFSDHFKVGETHNLKIVGYNDRENIVEVGLKQMDDNPWQLLRENYGEGSRVTAKVVKIDENGASVQLPDTQLEGYCHISQAARGKVEKMEDIFKVGSDYNFVLQKIDERNNRLVFSAKAYLIWEERGDIDQYMNQKEVKTMSLGDILNSGKPKKK